MQKEHEPRQVRSVAELIENPDALATSLTDLIDEMDRAAFRRSLASRDLGKAPQTDTNNVRSRRGT